MKKLAWLLIVISSFILVDLGQTLWSSLANDRWTLSYYHPAIPSNVFIWLVCSATLTLSAILTAKIRYEKSERSNVPAVLFGTIIGIMLLFVADATSTLLVIKESMYQDLLDLTSYLNRACFTSYAIVGFLTTLVGLWFGKPIVVDGGDSAGIKVVSWPFFWLAQKFRDRKNAKKEREAGPKWPERKGQGLIELPSSLRLQK